MMQRAIAPDHYRPSSGAGLWVRDNDFQEPLRFSIFFVQAFIKVLGTRKDHLSDPCGVIAPKLLPWSNKCFISSFFHPTAALSSSNDD